jgi:membrane-associated protease RseP (regulator of RpoE activity)
MITGLILLAAVAILGWGFYRARPLGKLGVIAWLQSVVLMLPWFLLFGLMAAGIVVNLAVILFLLLASVGVYIFLGGWLRAIAAQTLSDPTPSRPTPPSADSAPASGAGLSAPETVSLKTVSPLDSTLPLPIPTADLKAIQGIFGMDSYFLIETSPFQDGLICKGNLRGDPATVHARLSEQLQCLLPDQYRLFLVSNPEEKPVVIILPRRNDPAVTTLTQKILAVALGLATLATCLETSALLQGFDFYAAPERWAQTLPIALGLIAILGSHELGHRGIARRHQVRLSPPFFIPAWQIGSFGALNRFESLLPNRKVLFDIALAGPAVGGLVSFLLLILGLTLSGGNSPFQIPAPFFQSSILVGTLARGVLGSALQSPLVSVHPLVVIGWLGLVITALNLMPAGQLDGGRMVQAIYGRKIAARSTVVTLVVLAIAAAVNPLALYWAVLILLLQRDLERPCLEELSEVDDTRAGWGLLALFLMIATLMPLAPGLAGRLGIGG